MDMGTNAKIAIRNKDGSVESIYVNHDGYLSHTGRVLLNDYRDEEKVRALIELGDCSFIGSMLEPNPGTEHSFDFPQENVTVAYCRDRGEDYSDTAPIRYNDEDSFWNSTGYGFFYLFNDGLWYYKEAGESSPKVLDKWKVG